MARIFLENMVDNLGEGSLPPDWTGFDLAAFSPGKRLYEYQQDALRNALRALWKYYGTPGMDIPGRKQAYMAWYRDAGLEADLDLPLDRSSAARRKLASLLASYYQVDDQDHLPYEQFINRMCFWMATASGKTLVIVKMLELLWLLSRRGDIPQHPILVLAHRDDLIEQLRNHVNEFNQGGGLFIRLRELREYADSRHESPSLFSSQEITIYYYRSDNLSDERKEKIIDFRSYDNNGEWYILLDEAHKGDKEDSKRQHIYSILSRNGFLFNFSATFTDDRDIITTVSNFNLSEFTRRGHGKHICVSRQEVRSFRRDEDFSDAEKQKIVLKALIMLAYIRRFEDRVRRVQGSLYHRPMLVTLVNSVNTEDADLKLFFRELVRIGSGQIDETAWNTARRELLEELRGQPEYIYEADLHVRVNEVIFANLTQADLLRAVFNAPGPGEMEVLVRPSNRQEVAFKLKTSDDPFALVRIGDISEWLRKELSGYEINQHFTDEGFFERLNQPDSDINLLLGSRSFYEGWDSNRPNVIMYINIGTATEAKKFILQSVGRGVRIEPLKNHRKRCRELLTSDVLQEDEQTLLAQVKEDVAPLESLFIFGTNREALSLVISELDQEDKQTGERDISLGINHEAVDGKLLLIPEFQQKTQPLYLEDRLTKFPLTEDNLSLLSRYMEYVDDDRVFYALHGTSPQQIQALRNSLASPQDNFRTDTTRSYRSLPVLVKQSAAYFSIRDKALTGFKPLEDEIIHFRHIRVREEYLDDLERRIQSVIDYPAKVQEAKARYQANQITLDEYTTIVINQHQSIAVDNDNEELKILQIANHYYIPVLLSKSEKIDYIRSIIHVESEVKFLNLLENYLKITDNGFGKYDWWLFSRVDEKMDDIAIPFYYSIENRIGNFKPDFIFWFQQGNRYKIVYIDPKGTGRSEYQLKLDWCKRYFEENGNPKVFHYQDLEITLHVFLYTPDRNIPAEGYRRFWFDRMDQVLDTMAQ
ncbi:MAG TPA: DEAD/DEAH box helicase family protein [Anaerolineaceae bacterium]|nr:DEAD/DEAH box helicase family protein [Anaerolineaceae bacterium]